MFKHIFFTFILLIPAFLIAQKKDTVVNVDGRFITLSEIVIDNKVNVPAFIDRVKNDTTFYKAFRTLHIIGFTAINDIRMVDKSGGIKASLRSRIKQLRNGGCRTMQVLEENTTGDIYDADRNFNYYTAQMYASLFFTKDSICGENNIVKGIEFTTADKSGIEKHKEQLKMLFFNPGKRINGLPFMSSKTPIFDDSICRNFCNHQSQKVVGNEGHCQRSLQNAPLVVTSKCTTPWGIN